MTTPSPKPDYAATLDAFEKVVAVFMDEKSDQSTLYERLGVAFARIIIGDCHSHDIRTALSRMIELESGEFQPIETAPKDGTAFYVRYMTPFRFLPYKPASTQFKAGIKGRWQEMNDYGGWDNTDAEPYEWISHEVGNKLLAAQKEKP